MCYTVFLSEKANVIRTLSFNGCSRKVLVRSCNKDLTFGLEKYLN